MELEARLSDVWQTPELAEILDLSATVGVFDGRR
jgi:hypothetical protein